MPDKLTDSEIVKALECCVRFKQICPETCPMVNVRQCKVDLRKNTLALINRQKAENESLEIALTNARDNLGDTRAELNKYETLYELSLENEKAYKTAIDGWKQRLETAKAEAYKEFAERLKAVYEGFDDKNEVILYSNLLTAIDCLLIGMVGDSNAE